MSGGSVERGVVSFTARAPLADVRAQFPKKLRGHMEYHPNASKDGRFFEAGTAVLLDTSVTDPDNGKSLWHFHYAEVHGRFQGQGIATKLWNKAWDWAQKNGVSLVHDDQISNDARKWIATLPPEQRRALGRSTWVDVPGSNTVKTTGWSVNKDGSKLYDYHGVERADQYGALSIVAACYSKACAPPPAGTGGSDKHSTKSLFPNDEPQVIAPWPTAGRTKGRPQFDAEKVRAAIANPTFREFDPNTLKATQPWITRAGVEHYLKTDSVYADKHVDANKHPLVYERSNGQLIILAGHHRAAAAMIKGEPLRAIYVKE